MQQGAGASQPDRKQQTLEEPKRGDAAAAVAPTLSAYEEIRAKLAEDDLSEAAAQADVLASAATKAEAGAPEALRGPLSNTAKAAEALAKAPTDDADAFRKRFGEVSRSVIALLAAAPPLQEGLYLFECPMAQGYQKWVQRSEAIENPYMGQKMLVCGSKATWEG